MLLLCGMTSVSWNISIITIGLYIYIFDPWTIRYDIPNHIFNFFMIRVICHVISYVFYFLIMTTLRQFMSCFWLLFQEVQAALTGVPRARCQAARTTRHTVTLSLISVTPCHRSMPRSHATATLLRGSTGSCGTGQSGRRKRRRSAYWNAWRERRKAARPATGGVQAALETCAPPTPLVETCKQTLTHSAPTTKPGCPCFVISVLFIKLHNFRTPCFIHHTKCFLLSCPH